MDSLNDVLNEAEELAELSPQDTSVAEELDALEQSVQNEDDSVSEAVDMSEMEVADEINDLAEELDHELEALEDEDLEAPEQETAQVADILDAVETLETDAAMTEESVAKEDVGDLMAEETEVTKPILKTPLLRGWKL